MTDKAKYVREHRCKALSKITVIGVEQIQIPGKEQDRWYLRTGNELNEILFCPYCGIKLEEKVQ